MILISGEVSFVAESLDSSFKHMGLKLSSQHGYCLTWQSPPLSEPAAAFSLRVIIALESWAEPVWTKFILDKFLCAAARKKDLFPETQCARQIVPQPPGIFMDWQSKRGLPRGEKKQGKTYATGICPLVTCCSCTPALLIASLLWSVSVNN